MKFGHTLLVIVTAPFSKLATAVCTWTQVTLRASIGRSGYPEATPDRGYAHGPLGYFKVSTQQSKTPAKWLYVSGLVAETM